MAELVDNEPISAAAQKHVTRALPKRSRGRPARAGARPAPRLDGPEPPADAASVVVPAIRWHDAGFTIKAVTDRAYLAIGAEPPPLDAWVGFVSAWGAVAEYYLPVLAATPVPAALFATGVVLTPLAAALAQRWLAPPPEEEKPADEGAA